MTTKHKRYGDNCQVREQITEDAVDECALIPTAVIDGNKPSSPYWKLGLLLVTALGVTLGLWSLALAYLSTHPVRRALGRTPADLDLPFEDVSFPARDGVRLRGWFIPSPGARAGLILCHGHPNNRAEMLEWAQGLYPEGYHFLLFDFRALGESEGDLCSIGYHEVGDLLGAVDYMLARSEMRGLPVGVFGLSMGGAVALMGAAQDERIAAVATHGAFASLDSAIAQRCRLYFGPLGKTMYGPTTWWGQRWFPLDPRHFSLVEVVHRIAPRPLLLFHGGRDYFVPTPDAHALFEAAQEPKQLHLLPRSWHASIHPDELPGYEAALKNFFYTHLTSANNSHHSDS